MGWCDGRVVEEKANARSEAQFLSRAMVRSSSDCWRVGIRSENTKSMREKEE